MITVTKPGLHDTIQDMGRLGYQKFGVVAGGVMDPFSHQVANLLVGNEEKDATLEMTLVGPRLLFREEALIAICGGDLGPMIAGLPVPMWKPVFIRKGSKLQFGPAKKGSRAYLAVAGGLQLPVVLGSRSTYVRAGLGGFEGRALRKGDVLHVKLESERLAAKMKKLASSELFRAAPWQLAPSLQPVFSTHYEIRVMRGRQYEQFDDDSLHKFWHEPFTVSSQSDRMGYRVNGPTLQLKNPANMISEAVTYGSIQVPPDGNPIILAADRQTTGGYPKIGQLSSVDFTKLAQAKAGDWLTFTEVSIEESQRLLLKQETSLRTLRTVLWDKYR